MKIRVLSVFAILATISSVANAAVSIEVRQQASPDPGLDSYIIAAVGSAGESINSVAGLDVSGDGVHNVQPAFGQPSVTRAQWDAPNGAGSQDWDVFDTHLLFNPSDTNSVVGFIGGASETNDGSDPAGLGLMSAGQAATVGLGTYSFNSGNDQITVTPSAASDDFAFLQVVQPAGSTNLLNVTLFDNQGARYDFDGVVIGIPEPSTLLLGALGFVGLVARRRRQG